MSKELKFPQVYVVDASAGSGKTYALARRYVQLIINPSLKPEEIPIKNILAITFTNKATIEMKERILEFLKKIALNVFEDKEEEKSLLDSIGVDRKYARRKAYLVMDYIIKNYDYFQVQTIDSFINSLITGCSFKLDISSDFQIKTQYDNYLAYCLDNLIDRANDDSDIFGIFTGFLKQYLFIENNSSWFPKKNVYSLINSLFRDSNKYGGTFEKYRLKKEDIIIRKRGVFSLMKELFGNLPEGTNKRFANSLANAVDKGSFDIDSLSKYFIYKEFPVNKGCACPDRIHKLWKKIRKQISGFCELEARSRFNCYIDIFNLVISTFIKTTSKDDIIFLEELNKKARTLFDEGTMTVPELYYRLSARFRHYLIDEFQDTSVLQWRNLELMVEDALATGGSLFYVGDKKQAIYRFRGGDSTLFDHVREEFKKFNLNPETLNKNYRSQKEIVEFNNQIFSVDNLKRFLNAKEEDDKRDDVKFTPSDVDDIVNAYSVSRQGYKEENRNGYVRVEFIDAEEREQRYIITKNKVIGLIKQLKGNFDYKDIAILTRDNADVEMVTAWLLEKGINVESEKTLNIRENSLIKELVSFLRFLNSPIDNLSFASFVLGDIFTRAAKINRQAMQDFVFDIGNDKTGKTSEYLYKEFSERYPEVWSGFIEGFFKGIGFVPLYEFVVSIISKFGIIKNFAQYQGFFMNFLELIKKQEKDHNSLDSFLEYFSTTEDDDLYVNVSGTDSVKVLTVHKAKGLEFNVVIIPFLEIEIRTGFKGGAFVVHSENDRLSLLYLKKSYNDYSADLEEIYRQEYKKLFIDELNNIYVSFTRARNELYVFVPERVGKSNKIARYLIPGRNQEQKIIERGKKTDKRAGDKKEERALLRLPVSEYKDWINLLKDEFIDEHQLIRREAILKGNVIHNIISLIGNLSRRDGGTPAGVAGRIKRAILKTKAKFPFIGNFDEYEATVEKLIEDKNCKQFFFVEDGDVYQEKEIIDSSGSTRRIDRLIVTGNDVRIIDFKGSREGEALHREQVKEYLKLIKEIYPEKSVKGFLVYLDTISVEEING
jgi:ATP-dependent exoDNAse (exonuclease V) beta subunit